MDWIVDNWKDIAAVITAIAALVHSFQTRKQTKVNTQAIANHINDKEIHS